MITNSIRSMTLSYALTGEGGGAALRLAPGLVSG
jgi:hypothetical protein